MVESKKSLRDLGPGPDMTPVQGRIRIDVAKRAVGRSQLPQEALQWSIDTVQDATARQHLKKYESRLTDMLDRGTGLILSGDVGVGKTVAAALLGKTAMTWQYSVLMISHTSLQESLTSFEVNGDGFSLKERIRQVQLLILDGMNEGFLVDQKFGPLQVEELISRRNQKQLVTMLTTRLSAETFQKTKESRSLFSVMQGSMIGIRIKGDDLRAKRNSDLKRLLLEE